MGAGDTDWDALADRLGVAAVAAGEPTRWYDELWSAGRRGEVGMPWDRTQPHDLLAAYVEDAGLGDGAGRRAVVVGAGLGADAELLARHGWDTVAFDISPAAVTAARDRHPDSPVDYRVADLLTLPDGLIGRFDLVVEIFTVQALHPTVRAAAVAGLRSLVGPGGRLLVVQMVREDDEPVTATPPWRLDRRQVAGLAGDGLVVAEPLERVPHVVAGGMDRWRLVLTRP